MSGKIWSGISVLVFVSGILCGAAYSQTGMPAGADAFITSITALSNAAKEKAELGRSSDRLAHIKKKFTEEFLKKSPTFKLDLTSVEKKSDGKEEKISSFQTLLCNSRLGNLDIANQRSYLQIVASKIEEIGKPTKIENIATAVRVLFQVCPWSIRSAPKG